MDIRNMAAAAPTPQPVNDKDKSAQAAEAGSDPFAQLLQEAQPGTSGPAESAVALLAAQGLPEAALEAAWPDAGAEALGQDALADVAWRVDDLLGQQTLATAAVESEAPVLPVAVMDAALDAAVAALPQGNLGATTLSRWSGQHTQLPTAVGQTVSIVASGVQTPQMAQQVAVSASVAAAAEVAQAAQEVLQAADVQEGQTADTEGRWSLQGAWRLQDAETAPPAVQRLVGHIEQWAAQAVGAQRKLQDSGAALPGGSAEDGHILAQAGGSGTRLTEQAVRETQSAQQAAGDAAPDAPTEDMRFWLQGRQQRAELVLDRNGQPLRVQVSVTGNTAHITLRSDEAQTRAMLDASTQQLRELLQQQGLELGGVSVQAQSAEAGAGQERGSAPGWGGGRVQHASIRVDAGDAAAPASQPRRSAQGLDLYA